MTSSPDLDYATSRTRLVDWLRQQLIGPAQPDESGIVGISPLDRYPVGVLYPLMPDGAGLDPSGEELWEDTQDPPAANGKSVAIPTRTRRYVPPSAVGCSFFVRGQPRLHVTVEGSCYQREYRRDVEGDFGVYEHLRTPLSVPGLTWKDSALFPSLEMTPLGVDVRSRPFQDGILFTVTLYNKQRAGSYRPQETVEKSIFEACLTCYVDQGQLAEYPRVDRDLLTHEEQELEFQYRDRHIYAVGHGAAVQWGLPENSSPWIKTDYMPAVEVPQVTTTLPGDPPPALDMQFLAETPSDLMLPALKQFVMGYDQWVAGQHSEDQATDTPAGRIHARMQTVAQRMHRGVALLESDDVVRAAFQVANQAMFDQMRQQDRLQRPDQPPRPHRWRPFQLAFLLVVLESTVREDDEFRDVLDLIWFPTGGGKTEAYLGLIVFLIAWRRLVDPQRGGGTVAIMRYTLRLLTSQQFARATRIMFALELIRRADPELWGREPVSIGIWVGRASSPNLFRQAEDKVSEITDGVSPPNGLVLSSCPWCGADFGPRNYRAWALRFEFVCLSSPCPFGGSDPAALPCNVVDEALYQHPPTLLIGTIDKFARLAWQHQAGSFFGRGSAHSPPTLVIQDEMHLISGPLGSVAGLYEAALDTLLQMRGSRPKYIASTATIRMAREQVRSLYGRELAVFPPPGMSCDDSYFARTDADRPGRMYVGYLSPRLGATRNVAPLSAALLVGPQALFRDQRDREALLESWWTQVVYHLSLKQVGDSHTLYQTDIPEWTRRLSRETDSQGSRIMAKVAQLTSRATASDNADIFQRLERTSQEEDHLDVVLATNMVSVGLDVSRLALMVINSQPLTTAEYIQASSRVGRADVPGLVCVNYHRHQARSLSHYENFQAYHDSFYRFVEPTSVTPYTHQVRTRALHAALVTAVRHAGDSLCANDKAGDFNRCERSTQAVIAAFTLRCAQAEPPDQAGHTAQHIAQLAEQWHVEAERCRVQRRGLHYQVSPRDRSAEALLCDHERPDSGLWPTLHSMRNVESTSLFKPT